MKSTFSYGELKFTNVAMDETPDFTYGVLDILYVYEDTPKPSGDILIIPIIMHHRQQQGAC